MFALVVAAAQTCASLTTHGVYFVDKYNTRHVFLCRFKQIANTACAHAYIHFHKIGTGNGKKRNVGFACYRFCEQRFTCSGRAYEKYAARNFRTHFGVFFWMFQKFDYFFKLFLFFFGSRNVGKTNLYVSLHIGARLSEAHCALSAAHIAHSAEHDYHENNRYHDKQTVYNKLPYIARVSVNLNNVYSLKCSVFCLVLICADKRGYSYRSGRTFDIKILRIVVNGNLIPFSFCAESPRLGCYIILGGIAAYLDVGNFAGFYFFDKVTARTFRRTCGHSKNQPCREYNYQCKRHIYPDFVFAFQLAPPRAYKSPCRIL